MERTESIIQDFEWLLQVHRLLCKSFSIFSKSYSEWCDFCEFLTAEDIETEIKKLNTIFQNQSPYRVFLQYRGMFENVKGDIFLCFSLYKYRIILYVFTHLFIFAKSYD